LKAFIIVLASLLSQLAIAKPQYLNQKKSENGSSILVKADKSITNLKIGSLYVTITNDCECTIESFDASMPQHRHGMYVKASAAKLFSSNKSSKTYKIDGVKLHMPGQWELKFTLKSKASKLETLKIPYQLKN